MTDATSTTEENTVEENTKPEYEKGTWQHTLNQSTVLKDRAKGASKRASAMLWTGAQSAIEAWLPESGTDVSGENLYDEVKEALGASRKGDASKVKTVAVAVKDHGLVLGAYPNLSKAWAEAQRLTKTVAQHATEDDAAEKAVESITAPSSTTTVEGAAAILLSKGIDGAVVAILDALGGSNFEAHRSFARAVSTEISARVQAAKPKPVKKAATGNKGAAKPATGTSPKAAVKTAGAKPKAATKGKPVAKKAAPAKAAPVENSADNSGKGEAVETPEVPVAQKKGAPVVIQR